MPRSTSRGACAVRQTTRLGLEALEDRSLPSTTPLGTLPLNLEPTTLTHSTPAPTPTVLAVAPHVISAAARTSGNSVTGMRLTFSVPMKASSLNTNDVTLTGPNGKVTVTGVQAVATSNNTAFDVSFAQQSAPGTYTLHVSTVAQSSAGVALPAYQGTFTIAAPPVAPHVISAAAKTSGSSVTAMRLTFSVAMKASSLNTNDVTLTGPNGKVTISGVQAVAGSNNTAFDVSFATQTTPGTYTLHVSTAAQSSASVALPAYQGTFTITPVIQPLSSSSGPAVIAPDGMAVSLVHIAQNETIHHLQVKMNITYPNTGNLVIYLQAPNGTDILLVKYAGTGANFTNTVFDDNAGEWALFAPAPFTGTYQPMTPLSSLNGLNAQGTWKLWAQNVGGSFGTINSWSLKVN